MFGQITPDGVWRVAPLVEHRLESINLRGTELEKNVTDTVKRAHPRLELLTGPSIVGKWGDSSLP